MNKLKTAVVGIGHLGRHHLRWFNQLSEANLVGLYDINEGKAEKYSDEYQITTFKSLEELAGQVEVVSVVAPTTAHFEIASYLIERGIHCLIEKPIAATLDEASRLQKLAEKKGVKATVGHIERFNPAVQAMLKHDIKPSFIEAHRLAAFDPRGTDVAVVLDLMIHDIDLVLSFVNSKISDIQASAVAVVSQQADIANARLTFANGAVANLTASRISLREMRKLRIFQKSGYYSLDLAKKQADLYSLAESGRKEEGMRIPLGKSGQDLIYMRKDDSGEDMLKMELQSFLDAVAHDKPVAVPLEQATEALRIALEVDRIGRESLDRMIGAEPA